MFAVKCHDDLNTVFYIFRRGTGLPVVCVNARNQQVDLYEAGVRRDVAGAALQMETATSAEQMVQILGKHASDRWTYEIFNPA